MPIHHDKSVYGKLAPAKETISDDDLIAMAQSLFEDEETETNKTLGKKEDESKK